MHLTFVNWAKRLRMPPFNFRGKNRRVKAVEIPALQERFKEMEREERTMFILRHPYLTVEQSKAIVGKEKGIEVCRAIWNAKRNEKFTKTFTWAEQLSHLRVTDAWE